jgi:hypothetical protein
MVAAVVLLRHIWRRERVADPEVAAARRPVSWLARRAPALARPIPPVLVLGALGIVAIVTIVAVWVSLDTQGRYYLVAIAGTAGAVLFLVVWNEL